MAGAIFKKVQHHQRPAVGGDVMKYAVGCLAMAAALIGGPAQAVQLVGDSTWTFGSRFVHALRIGQNSFPAIAPAQVDVIRSVPQGYLSGIVVTAPVSGATYSALPGLSSVQTSGGVTLTSANVDHVSFGGSISISDLNIDLDTKRIYATLRGDFSGAATQEAGQGGPSRVETVQNFHLFDYQIVTGSTALDIGAESNFTLSGLVITNSGYGHFVSALRLTTLGPMVLRDVADYGVITTSITAVPEPSAYSLAFVGGVLIMSVRWARRKASQG